VTLLLSVKAGLRAKEIANLTCDMVTTSNGEIGTSIYITNEASKGRAGGRVVPLNRELRSALQDPRRSSFGGRPSSFVIVTERSAQTSPQAIVNLFSRWYEELGFHGCSSHSGRRTFITNAARKISTVGGSLRDIQMLAGHSNLATTQRYIESHAEAQRRIVELV
jgi:integrase